MGGGDLNAKKAWHPNTLKNQERVWKAEQAAAEEKKRIIELQKERAMERDREELNKLARDTLGSSSTNDNQLHWMYDKPDKKVQQEDYLLGKAIDKNYEQAGRPQQNEIPAVSRRVVGSSMLSIPGDVQVDLVRKLREDPLLLVKERERAARAALLNNPVQRSKLTELLRKEQEQKKARSEKKSKKKDKNLDDILTAKLNALSGEKGVNIAKLLECDDSSTDESSHSKHKKKKKKNKVKKKKKLKEKHDSDTDIVKKSKESKKTKEKNEKYIEKELESRDKYKYSSKKESDSKKHKSYDSDESDYDRKRRNVSPERQQKKQYYQESRDDNRQKAVYEYRGSKTYKNSKEGTSTEKVRTEKKSLNDKEKAARLAEMVAAGAEREIERGRRVAKQLSEIAADEKAPKLPRSSHNEARALPDSLENRIRSNKHYIQRDNRHMNEHFARR